MVDDKRATPSPAAPSAGATSNAWHGRVVSRGSGPASAANIANIITVVRILLAPLFVALLLADDSAQGRLRLAAAVLFVVAIVTDSLDGMLARRQNLITDLGKILDPIADKVLVGAALVTLSVLGELPWWVTVVIMVREVGITVFRFVVLRSRVIPASAGGKVKTVLQAVAISLYLFPLSAVFGPWILVADAILMGAALIVTVATGVDYLVKAFRFNRPSA
ncbi:MAG: CDP-diacylglycerol--glycerol-3-phosphate 3-phosphatidyltransferase [Microbacteriaceae bacterium]|nr:CDP-diacylglycerol--glycerol-3-phosphate 3-phosphatidyltransferase [Microbacteriaceae bacterium]